MKKTTKLLLLLLFFQATSTAQISIDSVHVFLGGLDQWGDRIVDSVYVGGTSNGPVFMRRSPIGSQHNDICGTIPIGFYFGGCDTIPFSYNKILPIGFSTRRIIFSSVWDTLAGCSSPAVPIVTDLVLWNPCFTLSINDTQKDETFTFVPNPAKNTVQISFEKFVNVKSIGLFSISGQLVKRFTTQERVLNVQDIVSGIYFLRVESNEGLFTKKVIIQH